MRKRILFALVFLFLALPALAQQPGYFVAPDCGAVDAAANASACLQTTTASGRTAGKLYVWSGASWVDVGQGPAGPPGAGGGYATVQDEGGDLTQRNKINFIGAGVTCVDNAGQTRTDCTIPLSPSSSDTLTNKTLDAEGTGNVVTVPVKFTINAAGCNNATPGPILEILTSNSAAANCYGTNPHRFGALDFADGANALQVGGHLLLPSDWTGSVDFKWTWFSSSTSTNSVVWTIKTACINDGEDVLAPTYNGVQNIADANNASASTRNSASQSSVTTTGCAAGETFFFLFGRDPTHASDTLAATASLMDLEVTYRRGM